MTAEDFNNGSSVKEGWASGMRAEDPAVKSFAPINWSVDEYLPTGWRTGNNKPKSSPLVGNNDTFHRTNVLPSTQKNILGEGLVIITNVKHDFETVDLLYIYIQTDKS